MSTFNSPRNRDAWATIRGYVYQVDMTIVRWLSLMGDDLLELECGEDIDVITRGLHAGTADEAKRLLEQVKHRERNITLRSSESIVGIANAFETLALNPDISLHFRFTTNSRFGRERGFPELKRKPAIEVWEELRSKATADAHCSETLAIQAVLKSVPRPGGIPDETWNAFRNGIDDPDTLLQLILRFEWSTEAGSAAEISPIVQRLLYERDDVPTEALAEEIYDRLFLFVFKTLCSSGRKQLTAKQLDELVAMKTTPTGDALELQEIRNRLGDLSGRVERLEDSVVEHTQQLDELNLQVAFLARDQEINATIEYVAADPITLPPLKIRNASPRNDAKRQLNSVIDEHVWTAVRGEPGSGKSQLALLAADGFEECMWTNFRNKVGDNAAAYFRSVLRKLLGDESAELSALGGLKARTLIVLDDLPRLSDTEELLRILQAVAKTIEPSKLRLLTLSHFELPNQINEALSDVEFTALETPPLTDSEASEILVAHGGTGPILNDNTVRFLNNLSQHHIATFTAVARYLERQSWSFSGAEFDAVMSGSHLNKLRSETLSRLLKSVGDSSTLELLFRLNLVLGRFKQEDAIALANVDPIIDRPAFRLNEMTGLWIQSEPDDCFSVATLVKHLKDCDLRPETSRECSKLLGERVLGTGHSHSTTPTTQFCTSSKPVSTNEAR